MNSILIVCFLGIGFSVMTKGVDLIDEHNWIKGKTGFILKYLFVFIATYIVYLSVITDKNLIPYFFAVLLFWLLNNKLEYPSHVLFCFNTGILIGSYINLNYILIGIVSLIIYGGVEFVIKTYKYPVIQIGLYKSLARFLIVPLGLSIYFSDYKIVIFVIPGLLSMHFVRYLIVKQIIKIEGNQT